MHLWAPVLPWIADPGALDAVLNCIGNLKADLQNKPPQGVRCDEQPNAPVTGVPVGREGAECRTQRIWGWFCTVALLGASAPSTCRSHTHAQSYRRVIDATASAPSNKRNRGTVRATRSRKETQKQATHRITSHTTLGGAVVLKKSGLMCDWDTCGAQH